MVKLRKYPYANFIEAATKHFRQYLVNSLNTHFTWKRTRHEKAYAKVSQVCKSLFDKDSGKC